MSEPTLTIKLQPVPPFDFELTAAYHTYFQARSGADNMDGGVYRRLLDLEGRLALAVVRSTGSLDSPELSLELRGDGLADDEAELAAGQVSWLLGLDQELSPFYAIADSDPALAEIVRQFWGLHLPRTATLFEALTLAILGQQISASVARMMRMLLIERYGASAQFDGVTYYAFPRPEAILASSPEELRTLKLTQRKAEYVYGIAGAALDPEWGELPYLPDAEVVRRLTALRGVGNWTAQWALVRGLARPDALPLGDLALRRGVSQLLYPSAIPGGAGTVADAEVEQLAERWRPWRSYATAYLFAAMRSGQGLTVVPSPSAGSER